jgi:hypothetical protein
LIASPCRHQKIKPSSSDDFKLIDTQAARIGDRRIGEGDISFMR